MPAHTTMNILRCAESIDWTWGDRFDARQFKPTLAGSMPMMLLRALAVRARHVGLLLIICTVAVGSHAQEKSQSVDLWSALRAGGYVVLLRHAQTVPGIGDPPGFTLEDCQSQRNLNDAGRDQSRAWGKAFTSRAIPVGRVFSSRWCRCMETARLAFGKADSWPVLNSHFDSPQSAARQAAQVKGGIGIRMQKGKNLVLVTHQVNITALSGRTPQMGHAVIMRVNDHALKLVGELAVHTDN